MSMVSDSFGDELVFFVNGKKIVERNAEPEMSLLTYLRRTLGLTGTKLGCAEGGCGACTVMVSKFHVYQNRIVHHSVNACLAPICSLHYCAVTTVEGIGSVATKLHPVQERIAKAHGSQCGFCTPGIVMSMYALLRNSPYPSMLDIEEAFQGNLCRCTGYRPILEGYRSFAKDGGCCSGKRKTNGCCMDKEDKEEYMNGHSISQLYDPSEFMPLDPTQELIFPPELMNLERKPQRQLRFKGEQVLWIQPTSLPELLDLKAQYPTAKLVVGNTEVGIEMKFKNLVYPVILAPGLIPELNKVQHTESGIVFGAACTLTQLGDVLRDSMRDLPSHQTEIFQAVLEQMHWFAGRQIRNVAAIGGNIMTASPISDLNPVFMAAGCKLTLQSKGGKRILQMDDKFFTGYRRTAIKSDEILLSIEIPYTKKGQYFSAFKQSQRREDDIAIVTCGMNVVFEEDTNTVKDLRLSYGGMAPTTVMAKTTSNQLIGRTWSEELMQEACSLLAAEMTLDPSAPGGLVTYRCILTISLFFKFYLTVQHKLANNLKTEGILVEDLRPDYASAVKLFHKELPSSVQIYQVVPPGLIENDVVGHPVMHLSALKQATGEAVYCDDIPHYENELYLALVTSTKAHAYIQSIDETEALALPGVVTFLCAKDIPGSNVTGPAVYDETVFADEMVTCVGHIVGAIVADTQSHAQRAAKAVKISYRELKPIVTIQEAISCKSFYQPVRTIERGNLVQGFQEADHILEGEIHVGGQEHFYLETHCTLAVPKREDGEMELFVSTQSIAKTQQLVAKALGVPANRIVCKVKRMGGGFGGKESRSTILSTVVALAAHKLKKPVRCMLDRDEDMLVTGGRHPFFGQYKVGFMKNGRVTALDVTYYSNAGNSEDLSLSIMERALFHMDNSYNILHIRGTGYICKTNLPSNTAFRGFGGPQGMMVTETWMSNVALRCGLPAEQVRRINMYKEGDTTPFNQCLEQFTINRCWDECLSISDYHQRLVQIEQFNKQNRWKKRGISIIPTKFGIAFTALFLNQAGALVHVYTDGSVLLTHGGTEMGQGLHTKMVQVASKTLGIPSSKIYISETSTNTVPNTSPTAASASSDLNGMAVYNACQTLIQRLEPYRTKNPKGSWEDWVRAAYFDRVNLSANGFYKTPDLGYNFVTNQGRPFNYFSYGCACSEVEIDCLTGDHMNLHTSIVMDVGKSLNPAIDIGQIEGAFMQGVGLFTLEELRYSPQGVLFTRGPGMYKIPAFGDIPTEFKVSLLRDAPNDKAIFSSKAVGEPPLFLAASVFYAIKEAIGAARAESGLSGPFRLDSPASPERIRNACEDSFTKLCPAVDPGTFTPWAVQV
ncbi:xanthine dehydrogenase/oxidase [Conger conger]|uniref:xanthine dehydrogenase/oxidase n=1 Tax=Conger conger TaxID=82655 RepID=UPI002A5AF5CC|nr:xanthine dehydrogenase/oxidase [Conger conger]